MPLNQTSQVSTQEGIFAHLLYLASLAFPTWGGLISALYIIVMTGGLRGLSIRQFWPS